MPLPAAAAAAALSHARTRASIALLPGSAQRSQCAVRLSLSLRKIVVVSDKD